MTQLMKILCGCLGAAVFVVLSGCEKKEPVLKIETPRAKIEVDKTPDGGSVEIQTERPAESTPP